jgi:hypothetical protein
MNLCIGFGNDNDRSSLKVVSEAKKKRRTAKISHVMFVMKSAVRPPLLSRIFKSHILQPQKNVLHLSTHATTSSTICRPFWSSRNAMYAVVRCTTTYHGWVSHAYRVISAEEKLVFC